VSNEDRYFVTYADLMSLTSNLVRDHVARTAWYASAISQRVDVDVKLQASVEIGMRKNWKKLATSSQFDGKALRFCFETIHRGIIGIWNFKDEDKILNSNDFKAMVLSLIHDLSDPPSDSNSNSKSHSSLDFEKIKEVLDALADTSAPGSTTPDAVSAGISNWLTGIYQKKKLSPSMLCTLMGFIVDLTMTLERLFWRVFRLKIPSLTVTEVKVAYEEYRNSDERTKVHQDIRRYVGSPIPKGASDAEREVRRLIGRYRFVESDKQDWDESPSQAGKRIDMRKICPIF